MATKINRQTPEARRASVQKYQRKLRTAVIEFLGGYCVICGFSDVRALQVDHINGGGRQERLHKLKNARMFLLDVLNTENKYQLLCANCNCIKRIVNKEHGNGK